MYFRECTVLYILLVIAAVRGANSSAPLLVYARVPHGTSSAAASDADVPRRSARNEARGSVEKFLQLMSSGRLSVVMSILQIE